MHVLKRALALLALVGGCWLMLATANLVEVVRADDDWQYEEREGEVCVLVYCDGLLTSEDCVPYRSPF